MERIKLSVLKEPLFSLRIPRKDYHDLMLDSLESYGYMGGIVYNKQSGRIVDGHLRVSFLQKLQIEEIDITVCDLSDTDEAILRLNLNIDIVMADSILLYRAINNFNLKDHLDKSSLQPELRKIISDGWVIENDIKKKGNQNVLF